MVWQMRGGPAWATLAKHSTAAASAIANRGERICRGVIGFESPFESFRPSGDKTLEDEGLLTTGAAGLGLHCIQTFFCNDRRHNQRGHGVGPPPTQDRVQDQPCQQNRREIYTKVGLLGIRLHSCAAEVLA